MINLSIDTKISFSVLIKFVHTLIEKLREQKLPSLFNYKTLKTQLDGTYLS